jgi:Ras-related GTP-binding protein A/B
VKELIKNLNILSQSCGAVETVIFEKNTFLLVAKSSAEEPVNNALIAWHNIPLDEHDVSATPLSKEPEQEEILQARANRFELISRLIKTFKNDTRKYFSEPFESLRMDVAGFTLVLDALTSTSYILVITSAKEPRISKISTLDSALSYVV